MRQINERQKIKNEKIKKKKIELHFGMFSTGARIQVHLALAVSRYSVFPDICLH